MQLANALHREFQVRPSRRCRYTAPRAYADNPRQAVVYNETVQAQLDGRVLTADQARAGAGLPRLQDIYIMSIKRIDHGTEEHWYPEIMY